MKIFMSLIMLGNWLMGMLNAYSGHWNVFAINSLCAVMIGLGLIIWAIDDLGLTKPK